LHTHLLAREDETVCPETSAFKTQTPGNYPKEIIQYSTHGEREIKKSGDAKGKGSKARSDPDLGTR
jgi:hypothetical protein